MFFCLTCSQSGCHALQFPQLFTVWSWHRFRSLGHIQRERKDLTGALSSYQQVGNLMVMFTPVRLRHTRHLNNGAETSFSLPLMTCECSLPPDPNIASWNLGQSWIPSIGSKEFVLALVRCPMLKLRQGPRNSLWLWASTNSCWGSSSGQHGAPAARAGQPGRMPDCRFCFAIG